MQGAKAREEADARVLSLWHWTLWPARIAGSCLTLAVVVAVLSTAFLLTSETGVASLGNDLRIYWAAARLALAGIPLAIFDGAVLGAEHGVNPSGYMPWLYPPGFLLLVAPLGLLSYPVAFLTVSILSVIAIAVATRPFTTGVLAIQLAVILAPAYLPTLELGQNNLLWIAGLLAALAALRARHWVLGGILIGCLTLKPQLGLLIPIALIAAGLWRSVVAAAVTALTLAVLPALAFGSRFWPLLLEALRAPGQRLPFSISDLSLSVGTFYFFTLVGLPSGIAAWLQLVLLVAVAVAVCVAWRSDRIGFDTKTALLLLTILLSAPSLCYYEASLMVPLGLFMIRAGILGWSVPHLLVLGLLWVGAGLQALNQFLDLVDQRVLGALIVVPTLLVCLGLLGRNLASTGSPPRTHARAFP